jgi:hypothetical protein
VLVMVTVMTTMSVVLAVLAVVGLRRSAAHDAALFVPHPDEPAQPLVRPE